jgi:tetratricopeptide (TPR) repeat protein
MPEASSATPSPVESIPSSESSPRRVALLLCVFVFLLAAWPLSRRWLLTQAPPRPSASADERTWAAYYLARIKADPSDAEAYLDLGSREEQHGFYNQASERLLIARGLGAPDGRTAGPLGRCWMKLGRTDEALAELEKAARLNPDSHEGALNLAQLLAETGQGDKASTVLRFFLKHHSDLLDNAKPAQREAVERLMVAFVGLSEPDMASKLAQQVIRLAPDQPNGYAVAGRCLIARKKWPDAALHLQRAVELAPGNADLHYLHGIALKHLPGSMDSALKEWQKAAELGSMPAAYGELAEQYEKRKDLRRAAIGYVRAATLTETDPDLFSIAEKMCQKNGQTDLATLCRARAAGLRSNNAAALKDYQVLARSKNPKTRSLGLDGAIDCYRLLQKPSEYLAFVEKECRSGGVDDEMRIADAYGELSDNARRVEHLKKALAAGPQLAGHIHHELGSAAANAGRRDEAEREMQLAIQAEPNNAHHHHSLALVLMQRRSVGGRLQRAIAEAERTAELAPDSAEDYHFLGTAYAAADLNAKAIKAFQHAIDLQPGYGPAYLELGKLYAHVGDNAQSQSMMQFYRKYQAFDLEKQTLITRANAQKTDPGARIALGDFYARAHDYPHALEQYRKAVRLGATETTHKQIERLEGILGMTPSFPMAKTQAE